MKVNKYFVSLGGLGIFIGLLIFMQVNKVDVVDPQVRKINLSTEQISEMISDSQYYCSFKTGNSINNPQPYIDLQNERVCVSIK